MTERISITVELSRSQVSRLPAIDVSSLHEVFGRVPVNGAPIVIGRGDRGRIVRAMYRPRDGFEKVDGGWVHRDNPGRVLDDAERGAHVWASSAPELQFEEDDE